MVERKVIVKEVGKPAEVRQIPDTSDAIHAITGYFSGYSAASFVPFPEFANVMLLCNDTGKLDGLPFNCYFGAEPLVGNVVFAAYDHEGETIDLTQTQITLLQMILEFAPLDAMADEIEKLRDAEVCGEVVVEDERGPRQYETLFDFLFGSDDDDDDSIIPDD